MKLIFATGNGGKVKEIKEILAGMPIEVVNMKEAGIEGEAVEDGASLKENALKKALYCQQRTGEWCFADDTGIFIEGLGGKPGIHAARWGGELKGEEKIQFILDQMKGIPEGKRQAYFQTTVALVSPEGDEYFFDGKVEGTMAMKPSGDIHPKFVYSFLFIPKGYTQTYAAMPLEEKNRISHRAKAVNLLKEFLQTHF